MFVYHVRFQGKGEEYSALVGLRGEPNVGEEVTVVRTFKSWFVDMDGDLKKVLEITNKLGYVEWDEEGETKIYPSLEVKVKET